jgi:hypothetical protein
VIIELIVENKDGDIMILYTKLVCGVGDFHLSEQHAILVSHGEMLINAPPVVEGIPNDECSM